MLSIEDLVCFQQNTCEYIMKLGQPSPYLFFSLFGSVKSGDKS